MVDISIKPSDVKGPLWDSPWKKTEIETVAYNLVVIARRSMNDEWRPFTWEDYVNCCSHTPSYGEKSVLDRFVKDGYLEKDDQEVYHFTRKILGVFLGYCDNQRV